jgi:hypothetical protein
MPPRGEVNCLSDSKRYHPQKAEESENGKRKAESIKIFSLDGLWRCHSQFFLDTRGLLANFVLGIFKRL